MTQSIEALHKANEVRSRMSKIKKAIRCGDLDPAYVVRHTKLPLTVRDVIISTPYYGASKSALPVDRPIGTFTTRDKYALIQRHNGGGAEMLTPADEPLRTLTTKGHQSLVTPGDVEAAEAMVDDCTFRMLQPHEIGAGMAFPLDYIVKGSKRDQVKGYGNAVTPPAARDLVGALAESLGHEVCV